MFDGVPAALMMLAQVAPAASAAPAQAPAPQASAAPAKPLAPPQSCPQPGADSQTIVICTERPQGYRLNPDVMAAKRATKSGGRPVRQATETPRPDCATVGPFPCVNPGVNLIGAALTAAEMAERLAKGEEVGSMFVTNPHPDEYHLYLMAKARREQEEAEKAALAKAKAAQAQTAQQSPKAGEGSAPQQPQKPPQAQAAQPSGN
jgi:hypothetical protein